MFVTRQTDERRYIARAETVLLKLDQNIETTEAIVSY